MLVGFAKKENTILNLHTILLPYYEPLITSVNYTFYFYRSGVRDSTPYYRYCDC